MLFPSGDFSQLQSLQKYKTHDSLRLNTQIKAHKMLNFLTEISNYYHRFYQGCCRAHDVCLSIIACKLNKVVEVLIAMKVCEQNIVFTQRNEKFYEILGITM